MRAVDLEAKLAEAIIREIPEVERVRTKEEHEGILEVFTGREKYELVIVRA